ncbi:MAG: hypothetical protein NUW37_05990 [Planctomycetes bacterium]|nr:hypothetical protein [Planctomycetota bacterium]
MFYADSSIRYPVIPDNSSFGKKKRRKKAFATPCDSAFIEVDTVCSKIRESLNRSIKGRLFTLASEEVQTIFQCVLEHLKAKFGITRFYAASPFIFQYEQENAEQGMINVTGLAMSEMHEIVAAAKDECETRSYDDFDAYRIAG